MRRFAEPIIAGVSSDSMRRAIEGKLLIDRFRADLVPIRNALDERYRQQIVARDRAIAKTSDAALIATAVIALELVVFAIVIARIQRELDRERGVVETLQRAASGRLVAPPHLAIGTAYRSATRGTSVGGDVYDVYRIDEQHTLLVVGDVSGKGVTAAVDTTFVRYALRALAAEHHGAAEIVRRFDALYRAADRPPESFVSLFVGVHQRDGTMTYANAGHGACWVRRGKAIEELKPTGPVVGIGGLMFKQASAMLRPGELLILATDGLTEARAPDGGFVPSDDVQGWLLEADVSNPQRYVDTLISAVTRYVHGRISDDLAVLTVTPR
jgi:serine phosphatase RsbU (regulator of sigma subunit)